MNRTALVVCVAVLAGIVAVPTFADHSTADRRDPSLNLEIDVESFVAPVITLQKAPFYSARVRHAGIQGQVVLTGRVDAEGQLLDLTVVEGPRGLKRAAKKAVAAWEFEAAQSKGQAIAVDVKVKVNFVLGDGDSNADGEAPSAVTSVSFSRPQSSIGS